MGFSIEAGVPTITVFLQGILSFLSPCVLPLIPLYIGYLAGGTKAVREDGTIVYSKKKVIINTLFFIVGISFTFFLLGFGFTLAGQFFNEYKEWFARIGGILVLVFGLYQLGIFGSRFQKEHRLPFKMERVAMNPLTALIFGFTFSFAWTPCVGPALASVLLMASSAGSSALGFLLIGVYTLGFVLPFLAVGLFTSTLLGFFKKHQAVVKYTVKIGGILMIIMGIMMVTGWSNQMFSSLARIQNGGGNSSDAPVESQKQEERESLEQQSQETSEKTTVGSEENTETSTEERKIPAIDFSLVDQNGVSHTLSEYKGKTVFLNFWATWCPPCRNEMPEIQELYEEYGENANDLVILGVANPKTEENPYNQDETEENVKKFLSDNEYTYPVVMDKTGETFGSYGISSFPTTIMIDKDGNVFGYAGGQLSKETMESIIKQTMEGKRITK